MQEIALFSGKIYTAGANFIRLPVVMVVKNLNSGKVDFQGVCLKERVKINIKLIFDQRIRAGVTPPSPVGGENHKFYTFYTICQIR